MTCAPGMLVANTAVPEASAAFSMRTSAGAPSATTIATGWTANRLPSVWKRSASSNAARWAIPSLSRLSSYSCATLICNMRLPGGDVLMQRARIGVGREFLTQLAVAQHLCELGQDAQVLLGRLFRHQQQEHQTDGLAVGRVERNRLRQAHESPDRFLQTLDPAVRNGESLPQAGRAETLAGEQAVEHQAPRHPLVVLEEKPGLLEHAFLARHIQVQEDVRRGQQLGN